MWCEDAGTEGGYKLTFSGSRRPSGDDIDELLFGDDDGGDGEGGAAGSPLDGLSKFIKGFQAL